MSLRIWSIIRSAFGSADLGALRIVKLGGVEARIAVFDGSYFALRLEVEAHVETSKPEPLLIYVPGEHPSEKGSPLKELECAGALYERTLSKVAKSLLKRTYTEGTIDEMFRDRKLGYDDVFRLLEPSEDGGPSILKLVLGDLDAPSMLARWLHDTATDTEIENKGGRREFTKSDADLPAEGGAAARKGGLVSRRRHAVRNGRGTRAATLRGG